MHRVGVDLGDDVLAHEADHLEGVGLGGATDTEHQLIGARGFPPLALFERIARITGDHRAHVGHGLDGGTVERGHQLGPVRDGVGVRERVVIPEHVAL